jgi:hypothetical protein
MPATASVAVVRTTDVRRRVPAAAGGPRACTTQRSRSTTLGASSAAAPAAARTGAATPLPRTARPPPTRTRPPPPASRPPLSRVVPGPLRPGADASPPTPSVGPRTGVVGDGAPPAGGVVSATRVASTACRRPVSTARRVGRSQPRPCSAASAASAWAGAACPPIAPIAYSRSSSAPRRPAPPTRSATPAGSRSSTARVAAAGTSGADRPRAIAWWTSAKARACAAEERAEAAASSQERASAWNWSATANHWARCRATTPVPDAGCSAWPCQLTQGRRPGSRGPRGSAARICWPGVGPDRRRFAPASARRASAAASRARSVLRRPAASRFPACRSQASARCPASSVRHSAAATPAGRVSTAGSATGPNNPFSTLRRLMSRWWGRGSNWRGLTLSISALVRSQFSAVSDGPYGVRGGAGPIRAGVIPCPARAAARVCAPLAGSPSGRAATGGAVRAAGARPRAPGAPAVPATAVGDPPAAARVPPGSAARAGAAASTPWRGPT